MRTLNVCTQLRDLRGPPKGYPTVNGGSKRMSFPGNRVQEAHYENLHNNRARTGRDKVFCYVYSSFLVATINLGNFKN